MNSDYYRILFHDIVLADHMTLETALILLEALFQKFYNEPTCAYTIEKTNNDTEDTDELYNRNPAEL